MTVWLLAIHFTSFSESLVTQLLLSDPGFQLSGLAFMLGGHTDTDTPSASARKAKDKIFDFRNCMLQFTQTFLLFIYLRNSKYSPSSLKTHYHWKSFN